MLADRPNVHFEPGVPVFTVQCHLDLDGVDTLVRVNLDPVQAANLIKAIDRWAETLPKGAAHGRTQRMAQVSSR